MPWLLFFTSLVFFKGVTPLLFDRPISVVAAVLIALATSFAGALLGIVTVHHAALWRARRLIGLRHEGFPSIPLWTFGALTVALAGVSYFVLLGFSERLYRKVTPLRPDSLDWLWFAGMVATPLLFHFLFLLAFMLGAFKRS